MDPNKTNDDALRWRIQKSERPYANKTSSLRVDTIQVRNGDELEYAYLERAPAVIVVPVTREGEIVILRQYRYPVDEWCVEVPAGGTHDTGDESLPDVVRKELCEEIGATCGALTHVGFFYSGPAVTDEKCHVFLAENVDVTRQADTEPSEQIKVELAPADKVVEMARTGKMKNSPCTLAVLWCEPLLRERGYI